MNKSEVVFEKLATNPNKVLNAVKSRLKSIKQMSGMPKQYAKTRTRIQALGMEDELRRRHIAKAIKLDELGEKPGIAFKTRTNKMEIAFKDVNDTKRSANILSAMQHRLRT